jgi:hypothetical protein
MNPEEFGHRGLVVRPLCELWVPKKPVAGGAVPRVESPHLGIVGECREQPLKDPIPLLLDRIWPHEMFGELLKSRENLAMLFFFLSIDS